MFLENIANPPRQLSLQTGMMCIGNLNTMRMFHPILIEDTVEIQTTKQGNANILLVHVENVLKNFKRKDLQGNPYNNYHQLSIPYFLNRISQEDIIIHSISNVISLTTPPSSYIYINLEQLVKCGPGS